METKRKEELTNIVEEGIHNLEYYDSVSWKDKREEDCRDENGSVDYDESMSMIEADLKKAAAPLVKAGVLDDDVIDNVPVDEIISYLLGFLINVCGVRLIDQSTIPEPKQKHYGLFPLFEGEITERVSRF